ncbi:hypothetical protein Gasu2_23040 [Galdieria sulphuraria]|uniref:Peptidylprolyl isomerase n=1 Tax=Galdieria sulphuraria TaxID=130081 RepID=M2XHZ7_GALSU|nr:hypothetical protein Gasu_29400 isoform 1 [Galdieria sulphuraria]XP_005706242.1 hypothetical protein Gasu_29400 isoform 2 [Galdieria sulphuraria]EME29721.1 hypothetical protein isoform 1 [Galdieria sulphuraria]EME29722.1 hypothetical protein isoform 2 [Galdieria sulphuraria]GJD07988.1 hypothetical protein Gasu2_23040 [Galdieria sulphuraria]|eukprot:XP_005706241.1 hypothetical protein isoform 1 [Galdieria sulphuraria]
MAFNWTLLLTNGTLQLVKSGTGDRPRQGDKCLVQCKLMNNFVEEKDTEESEQSLFKFWLPLGRGFYSRDLEQIVSDLYVGSECVVRSSDVVDPNKSTISLHLSLLDVIRGETTSVEQNESSCILESVSQLKNEAKHLMSNPSVQLEQVENALDKYEEAFDMLYSHATATMLEKQSFREVMVGLRCNLAICYNRLSKPYMAWLHSNAALNMRPMEVKAVFQRAKAYLHIGDLFNAYRDIQILESCSYCDDIAVNRLKAQVEQAIDRQSKQNDRELLESFQVALNTRSFVIPSHLNIRAQKDRVCNKFT